MVLRVLALMSLAHQGQSMMTLANQGHPMDREQGRTFWYGNGTAMVNTTTVAVTTSFFTIVALGFMSILHEANLKAEKAARDATSTTTTTTTPAPGNSRVDEQEQYRLDMERYEQEYEQYLKDYAAWARQNGQDPNPDTRQKR